MSLTFTKQEITNGTGLKKWDEFRYNQQKNSIVDYYNNIVMGLIFRTKETKLQVLFANYRVPDSFTTTDGKTSKIEYTEALKTKLQSVFTDSVVTIDPLKTYILIDWS